jgi:hypothetical protein
MEFMCSFECECPSTTFLKLLQSINGQATSTFLAALKAKHGAQNTPSNKGMHLK